MRKQSFSKKLTASVCTAALALSMPMMAYATGADGELMLAADETTQDGGASEETVKPAEGAPELKDGSLIQEVEVTAPTNENVGLTGEATVKVTVTAEDELDDQDAVNSKFAPTKEEIADGAEAATPIVASTNEVSEAYNRAINGGLNKADENIDVNEVIGTSSFKLSTSGAKADGNGKVVVTVAYTADENAEGVSCRAYISIYDAEGKLIDNIVKDAVQIGNDGTCNISVDLLEGQTADVTLALQNLDATDPTTENQTLPEKQEANSKEAAVVDGTLASEVEGTNNNGKVTYNVTTATVQQLDKAGNLVWNVQGTGQFVDAHTTEGAENAAGALKIAPGTTHPLWANATAVDQQNAISDAMNFTVTGDEGIENAKVVVKLPGMDGKIARVYLAYNGDNSIEEIVVTNGQIVLSDLSFSTRAYTVVLFDNGTTVNPGDDIVPPVDPENPDNPAVVPGEDVTDPTDEGTENGSKDKANGVKAADNGKTSPKTGVIL